MTSSLRVLVADDDPFLRALLQLQLESEGHHVILAGNGSEAIRLAGTAPPDLVILDIAMPGIDGLTVTRVLREQAETATLPIVLLTGRDTDGDIVAGWKSGANYYLTKPFHMEQLHYFIRTLRPKPKPSKRWVVEVD